MAARRGKSQARRNTGGPGGLPGWAWLLLGAVLATVLVLGVPKLLDRGEGDGFFRPTPNPDAQPASPSGDEPIAGSDSDPGRDGDGPPATQYDFYKLLPADEVPMTDAELAATERAEAERRARMQADDAEMEGANDDGDSAAATTAAATPAADASPRGNDAPYILQAGAFGASGDAEAVKARIALLGLTARVESATISGKTVYRVRLGPYGTASELAEAKRKLADAGLQTLAIKAK